MVALAARKLAVCDGVALSPPAAALFRWHSPGSDLPHRLPGHVDWGLAKFEVENSRSSADLQNQAQSVWSRPHPSRAMAHCADSAVDHGGPQLSGLARKIRFQRRAALYAGRRSDVGPADRQGLGMDLCQTQLEIRRGLGRN